MSEESVDALVKTLVLRDFRGKDINLADYHSQRHVILVFNRGFG